MVKYLFFLVVLLSNVACQHYTIKSKSVGDLNKLKSAKYKVVSVSEAESDPFILEREQNVTFSEVNEARKADFKKAFSKEKEEVFGNSNDNSEEIFVNAKINRRVLCKFGLSGSVGAGSSGLSAGYKQMGNVVLNLVGLSQTKQEVFNVNIEYDMNSSTTSIVKSWACDSFDKVTKVINENILPLAIKEIGQNRVTEK